MRLSITMMVKNEQENLERCLKSLQPIRDGIDSELIIVDTGSDDRTVEIAKKYTDKIYFHPWENDFSAMRNITIGYAKGEWILIMDADEELVDYDAIIDFLQSADRKKYGAVAISGKNITDSEKLEAYSIITNFRLFKNDGYFHYDGAVHNQPIFKGKELILQAMLVHYGYLSNDAELMEKKFLRTSTILRAELEKEPENIYYWTQLSVTYGMHKEFNLAVEYAEKAYTLYQKNKPTNCMFIFANLAMMQQQVRNFKRVEEICVEAVTIQEGFIDIYYYLAESQAVLGKLKEAVSNYGKYLTLVNDYYKVAQRDISVIDYTLGNQGIAYYNLSNIYKKLEQFELALQYAEKITDPKSIQENFSTIIFLYLKLGKFTALKDYYNENVQDECQADFYEKLTERKKQFSEECKLAVAKVFGDVNNYYGLLSSLIVEDHNGFITKKSKEAVTKINIAELPVYCSEILYYLLKHQYPLGESLVNYKEIWMSHAFDYIVQQQEDLCDVIYRFLQKTTTVNDLSEYKMSKVLCRNALLLNKLSDLDYQTIFERYIQDGVSYLEKVYKPSIIDNIMIYEVKNDEEIFLIYMAHAQKNKQENHAEYVKYLRMALQAFPEMKKGIEIRLHEIQSVDTAPNNEFDNYKTQVKTRIKQLIENGKMDEAKTILVEYKSIVPHDMEAILLETKILLN